MRKNCALLLLLICVSSCASKSEIGVQRLADVKEIIPIAPDSAVNILLEIDPSSLPTKMDRAEYSLLLIIAKDKAYIEHEDDKDILSVENYYRNRGNDSIRSVVYFYLGRVYEDLLQNDKALKAYITSKSYTSKGSDYKFTGKVHFNIGRLYYNSYDFEYAQHYFEEAIEYFSFCDDTSATAYSYSLLGCNYSLMGEWSKALEAYQVSNELYLKSDDRDGLLSNALIVSGIYYDDFNDHIKADSILTNARHLYNDDIIPLSHYPLISRIQAKKGEQKKAIETLEEYIELNQSISDETRSIIRYMISTYYQEIEDYKNAYYSLYEYVAIEDNLNQENINSVLREVEKKYEKQELENEYRAYKKQKAYQSTIIGLVILIASILVVIFMMKRRREMTKLQADLDSLESHMGDFDDMKDKITSLLDEKTEKESRLQEVLTNKMLHIQRLVDYLFLYENHSDEFRRKVKEGIVQAEKDEYFGELHEIVNEKCYGVVDYLREKYPSLSDDELNLCCLVCFGFNNSQIGILFGHTNPNSVFNKRHKLRVKFGLCPGYESLDSFIQGIINNLKDKKEPDSFTCEK